MNSTSEAEHVICRFEVVLLCCAMFVTYALLSLKLEQGAFCAPLRNVHQFFLMKIEPWLCENYVTNLWGPGNQVRCHVNGWQWRRCLCCCYISTISNNNSSPCPTLPPDLSRWTSHCRLTQRFNSGLMRRQIILPCNTQIRTFFAHTRPKEATERWLIL